MRLAALPDTTLSVVSSAKSTGTSGVIVRRPIQAPRRSCGWQVRETDESFGKQLTSGKTFSLKIRRGLEARDTPTL